MQYRYIIHLILYAILGAAVFLTNYLEFPLIWAAAVSGLVFIAIPLTNQLEKLYDSYIQLQQKRDVLKRLGRRYNERISELGFETIPEDELIDAAVEGNIEPSKNQVYKLGIEIQFEELERHRQDIIHVLILCREINLTDDPIEQAGIKARLSDLLSNFDFIRLDDPTLDLLSSYKKSLNAIEHGGSVNQSLFDRALENPRDLSLEFVTSYGTTEQLAVMLFSDKERSDELRQTLGKLIARGKLSTKSVNKETAEKIQSELEDIGLEATKFIVFSQILQRNDSVESAIEKFPHMRVGTKHPNRGFPEEIEYMRMYLVYPDFDYGTAENFLQEEIIPSIPDNQENGFIAVMPLRLRDLAIYPEPDSVEEFLSGTYESLNFLKTGKSEDLAEIVLDRIFTEIGVSKLLATIPFNVMVPDIDEREKEIIIEHYEDLKAEFDVNELFDWADVDSDKLGQSLNNLDGADNREMWMELAEKIVSQAKRYDKAAYGDPVEVDD